MSASKITNSHGLLVATIVLLGSCSAEHYDMEEYIQIIPRGDIPAITDPQYVTATEAGINDDAYVLGIVIEGQARAYSLRLLNNHEIVNDQIGELAYAAVW